MYTWPEHGVSVILIADQVLWFGDELHCSLINPHQILSHGYSVCDDPWDPHRSLGIKLDSIFIPLTTSGPNLFFESRVPTDWEISNLPIIEITALTWNPADLHMSGPHLTMTHVVDCISTAQRDIWSQLTAPLSAISPVLDLRCVSSLYANAVLVNSALTGPPHTEISATFTGEHSAVLELQYTPCTNGIMLIIYT